MLEQGMFIGGEFYEGCMNRNVVVQGWCETLSRMRWRTAGSKETKESLSKSVHVKEGPPLCASIPS